MPAPLPRSWNKPPGTGIMRENIILACTKCKRKNYTNTKNKKLSTARLEFNKFCPFCRSHTKHRETR